MFLYFWRKGEVVFSERQRSPVCFLFPPPLKDSKSWKAFNSLQLNTHGCFFFQDTFYYNMCSKIYCLLKFLKEHVREQPSWKGRGQVCSCEDWQSVVMLLYEDCSSWCLFLTQVRFSSRKSGIMITEKRPASIWHVPCDCYC